MAEKKSEKKNEPLALEVIAGLLVLTWMIAPFLAIWFECMQTQFAYTTIWAFILSLTIHLYLRTSGAGS